MRINELLISTRWSISYIIAIPFVIAVFLFWNATQRIADFKQSHFQIAESTSMVLANKISKQIKNQQRLLSVFAKNESHLLLQLLKDPENENLVQELNDKVLESFPDYFAVSLTDHEGIPKLDEFDERIGDLCLDDLKQYAEKGSTPIRIHPNSVIYHVDIIVPWSSVDIKERNNSNSGLLFVSFKPNFIYQILELSSPPQHELMLINRSVENLIEMTEHGSRIVLDRDDFRLNKDERSRRLYSVPVNNSAWNIVDFQQANLFSDYEKSTYVFSFVILLLFIVVSLIMAVILFNIEKSRIAAEKMKEEMFSLFNHDLRAPLTSIFGFLDMYVASGICEKQPEKCKKLAATAKNNATTMLAMIGEILDMQKMDSGEMSFEFSELDIVSVINDTVEMNIQYGLLHNVNVKMKSIEEAIFIIADSLRIKQAVTNLITNAVKYSPEQSDVIVTVKREKNGVTISVSDKGPGIEKSFQEVMFNKFSQSKSKLTKQVGGTGLGLAIVKHVVDKHKGRITFETNESAGTTFTIALPTLPN